jgi:hypothetical protein
MISFRSARPYLIAGLAVFAIGLPVLGVLAKPKPVVVEAPPPPPPPPPEPAIGMSRELVELAAAYQGYMHRAASISPAFTDGPGVASALRVGSAYEPTQLIRGEISYAAIAALQDPTFVASLRAAGATAQGRYQIVAKIFADPSNVFTYPGAQRAGGLAKAVLASDGMNVYNAGSKVKQAAYDIQHQSWSLLPIQNLDAREEDVKSLSRAQMPTAADEVSILSQAAAGQPGLNLGVDPAPPPYSPLVTHAVALAALAAIGQAAEDEADNLNWLFDSYFTDHCLADAKRALYECLAVAKPHYEDVFCLGQHAMTDTATCVVKGAGSAVPLELVTRPFPISPAHGGAHHTRKQS